MPTKVLDMLPQGRSAEASYDHVMVQVMPQVLEGYFPEETTICTQDVVRTGLHLPPNLIMIQVLPYRHQGRHCGRKWDDMSSNLAAVNAAAIYSYLRSPSGCDKFVFRSLATGSYNPRGCSLSAATTLSIVNVLSGDR